MFDLKSQDNNSNNSNRENNCNDKFGSARPKSLIKYESEYQSKGRLAGWLPTYKSPCAETDRQTGRRGDRRRRRSIQ